MLDGTTDPDDYLAWREDSLEPIDGIPEKEPTRYRSALRTSRWNNELISAFNAHNIAIIGEVGSMIIGMNCYYAEGEEGYRGPHGIDFRDGEQVTLYGYTLSNTRETGRMPFSGQNLFICGMSVYSADMKGWISSYAME